MDNDLTMLIAQTETVPIHENIFNWALWTTEREYASQSNKNLFYLHASVAVFTYFRYS